MSGVRRTPEILQSSPRMLRGFRLLSRPPHSYIVASITAAVIYAVIFFFMNSRETNHHRHHSRSYWQRLVDVFRSRTPAISVSKASSSISVSDSDANGEDNHDSDGSLDSTLLPPEDSSLPLFVMCVGVAATGKSRWCAEFMAASNAAKSETGVASTTSGGGPSLSAHARVTVLNFVPSLPQQQPHVPPPPSATAAATGNVMDKDAKKPRSPTATASPSSPFRFVRDDSSPHVHVLQQQFTLVSSDDVRRTLTGSINNQFQNDAVWAEISKRVIDSLKSGNNTLLDATNLDTEKRRQFIFNLPPCRLRIKIFHASRSATRSRIAADLKSGVDRAAVPEKVLEIMHRRFPETLLAIQREPWRPFQCGEAGEADSMAAAAAPPSVGRACGRSPPNAQRTPTTPAPPSATAAD